MFDEASIVRMCRALRQGAGAVYRSVRYGPLADLTSWPSRNEKQVLKTWNNTSIAVAAEGRVHRLFERQAAATPRFVATIQRGQSLTYRDLTAWRIGFAHFLIARGVRAEIGWDLQDSSMEMIIAISSLKACGAYLPLDPHHPDERAELMLTQSEAKILISHPQRAERVSRLCQTRRSC